MITKEQKEKLAQESKKIADNISQIKHRIVIEIERIFDNKLKDETA